jgi:hypothetical protein
MTNQEFIESISLPNEEWRDVFGYDYEYKISSFGRLVSLYKRKVAKNGSILIRKPKILKPYTNSLGYNVTSLQKGGRQKMVKLHRLVAEAFLENPQNFPAIDHIDRDKQNNCVSNLQWCNQSLNMQNPLTKAVMSDVKSKPVVCIYPDNKTKNFKSAYVARFDGFDPSSITKVCKNKKSTHKGCRWMYLSDYEKSINKSKNA